jgi:S1-C subfamily serine protease
LRLQAPKDPADPPRVTWPTILPVQGQNPVPEEPRRRRPRRKLPRVRGGGTALLAALTLVAVTLSVLVVLDNRSMRHSVQSLERTVAADQQAQQKLQAQITSSVTAQEGLQSSLQKQAASQINSGAIAPRVLKSVFTIEAGNDLGTAFAVRRSSSGGTVLITNYHVVASVWSTGGRMVTLHQGSRSISGQIDTVRPSDDLASVEVLSALPLLPLNRTLPPVGAPVLVVGSPLGLGGTVTTGVVSAHRSGLIQISAPISPGNSGGPVVDAAGRAVGIASEKIVSNYAEGLGFAIPIRNVCTSIVRC